MLTIEGHCTYDRALSYERVFLFTCDGGRTFAVISSSDGKIWGLYLVVSDEEYETWANYFCR